MKAKAIRGIYSRSYRADGHRGHRPLTAHPSQPLQFNRSTVRRPFVFFSQGGRLRTVGDAMCRVYMNLRVRRCLLFRSCYGLCRRSPRRLTEGSEMLGSSRRMTVARPARPHGARQDGGRGAAGVRSRGSGIADPAFFTRALMSRVRAAGPPGRYPSVAGSVAAGRPVAARRQRPRGGPARKTPRFSTSHSRAFSSDSTDNRGHPRPT